ncbi:DUF4870 domain-containing protein [Luteimonas sp. 3794]|uniref:DUF4870 domain-containing protein n=1 Tax=Luteimonas sp. 3794 TaxID=2817730 RepID=UPI00285DCDE2|nr:DUF4870 domain-containing protein [Luteimonas sp. 3794]MDR6992051.1 putative Tic20 family protein [Luteimonas sp. 3794]
MQTASFPQTLPASDSRHWAAAMHLGALVLALLTSWISGVAGALVAGMVYLLKRESDAFVAAHAREALNFHLSMCLYACAIVVAAIGLLGATVLTLGIGAIVTLPAGLLLAIAAGGLAMLWLISSIVAAVRALNGEHYVHPLTIRFFGG